MTRLVVGSRARVYGATAAELAHLREEHEHKNPDHGKARKFGFAKRVPRLIVTWRAEEDGSTSFPRGSVPKIRAELGPAIRDERSTGDEALAGLIPQHKPPSGHLWPHQELLVEKAYRHQNALMRAAAGSGKTTAALALASLVNLPTLVVVHSKNLFDQWIDRCVAELGVPRSWVGQIQGSVRHIGSVTVGMQQTLYACAAEVAPAFGMLIVDEVHRTAARTFLEVVDCQTAKYRVGVTDDERRSDGKEFLVYDLFGPVVAEADHDDLVAHGFIMDVRVRVVPTDTEVNWYLRLSDKEKLLAHDKLLEHLATDPKRNDLVLGEVPPALANGHQVVIFTSRVEHAYTLDRQINASGCRSGFVIGAQRVESRATLERLRAGTTNVVVGTYQALGTGVDMPKVSRGVFAMPIANSQKGKSQFKQYRGRFTRSAAGKQAPEIVYLWDRKVFGAKPLRHLCRWANDVKVEWGGKLVPGRQVLKEIVDDEA